jgi:hypothetical protein
LDFKITFDYADLIPKADQRINRTTITKNGTIRRMKMNNLEQKEKKMNPLAHAVYDQVLEEFISGDTSCFFQTLCQIEDLNNPSIKEFMQG